eukprot:GEMP01029297.1.p1 GENE.GEMP01029297.1~~GEMP01029297.1.p1  ORF type:complete len:344 (+),score=65.32 GEMP01029297.1:154-1185(+)
MGLGRTSPHFDKHGYIVVRKKPGIFLLRVIPLLLAFSVVSTLAMFLINYSRIVGAHTGKCKVKGFVSGLSCTECSFEVDVGGDDEYAMAIMRVEADYAGHGDIMAKMDAFRCCPKQSKSFNCCSFGPTLDGHFCDAQWHDCTDKDKATRWDCYYHLSPNTTKTLQVPYDVQEGTIDALYAPVLISLAVFAGGGWLLLCVIKNLTIIREKQIAQNSAIISKQVAYLQAQRDLEEEEKERESVKLAALCQRLRDTTQAAGSNACFEKDPLQSNFRRTAYSNLGALEEWPINTPLQTPDTPVSPTTRSPPTRSSRRKQLRSLSPSSGLQIESTQSTHMAEISLGSH